ncbi:MAG: hypothetical protein GX556_14475 [Fibrobacter sp.]|nr:hypothetical protein [Fibrobacter sp.]
MDFKCYIDMILESLPRKKWNSFSLLISYLTFPYIGSPIRFSFRGFTIKEYDLTSAPEEIVREYFKFCYPSDEIEEPEREFDIDRQYWPSAQTFIVTRNSDGKIAGCMQLVHKTGKINLPVECSRKSCNGGSGEVDLQGFFKGNNLVEFYRCRRSMELTGAESAVVVPMLFKAGFAKTIQKKNDYCMLSYDSKNSMLRNLYLRKLAFKECGVSIKYPGCDKEWDLLYVPTHFWYNEFASISKTHFSLITYFRKNLKFQRTPARDKSEEYQLKLPVIFAEVLKGTENKKAFPAKRVSA